MSSSTLHHPRHHHYYTTTPTAALSPQPSQPSLLAPASPTHFCSRGALSLSRSTPHCGGSCGVCSLISGCWLACLCACVCRS